MKRIKLLLISLLTASLSLAAVPAVVAAVPYSQGANIVAATSLKSEACSGLRQVDSTNGCGSGSKDFYKVIDVVVNLLSYLIGVIAIIMVMVGGVKYMTSGGDPQKVSSAKTTLIYALIGLAIVALAQFLVAFVLHKTNI